MLGVSLGIPRDSLRILKDSYGFPWIPRDSLGIPRDSLRILRDSYGFPGIPQGPPKALPLPRPLDSSEKQMS